MDEIIEDNTFVLFCFVIDEHVIQSRLTVGKEMRDNFLVRNILNTWIKERGKIKNLSMISRVEVMRCVGSEWIVPEVNGETVMWFNSKEWRNELESRCRLCERMRKEVYCGIKQKTQWCGRTKGKLGCRRGMRKNGLGKTEK